MMQKSSHHILELPYKYETLSFQQNCILLLSYNIRKQKKNQKMSRYNSLSSCSQLNEINMLMSHSPFRNPEAGEEQLLIKKLDELIFVVSKAQVSDKGIFTKALDDIVNVNSLFTVAMFVGFSAASPDQHSLENRQECDAGLVVGKRLVLFEVVSFACFLFSSLVAKSLKVYLNIFRDDKFKGLGFLGLFRGSMFSLSVLGSIVGVLFLTLSMSNVIQLKVGLLSCGSSHALVAVISLSVIVLLGLLIYLSSMIFTVLYLTRARRHV